MRASATSRNSSAAHYAAAQAKPNADKADQASPFALLLDTVASKDTVGDRPAQKDASNSAAKAGDDKPAKAQDNQDAATQTASPTPAKPKPEKSDKSADKNEIKAGGDADPQASAADPKTQDQQVFDQAVMPANPQNVPPPPPVAQAAIPADGESDDLAVDMGACAAPKPPTDIKAPQKAPANGKPEAKPGIKADTQTGTPAKTPVKQPVVTAQTPAVTDDSGGEDIDVRIAEPASQTAPAAAKTAAPVQAPGTPNVQTATAADDKGKPVQNAGPKNTNVQPQDTAPNAAPDQNTASKVVSPKDVAAKTDTSDATPDNAGKSAGIKNTTPKARTIQADMADNAGKADTARSDVPQSDRANAPAPQIDVPTAAAAPKAEPHPAPQAIFAVNSIAAPQAAQSSPVASAIANANAHIQVSAQAAPDLPVLAVEIAARSKSGAKQFDIRLDPPELGRVEVRLSIDATGKASAHLSADQPQTLSLLQKDAPVLTRALRDAGLDVSQDGLNFSLRQQNENSSGDAGNNGRRGSSRGFPLSASVSIDATAGNAAYRAVANGRLDIRV